MKTLYYGGTTIKDLKLPSLYIFTNIPQLDIRYTIIKSKNFSFRILVI